MVVDVQIALRFHLDKARTELPLSSSTDWNIDARGRGLKPLLNLRDEEYKERLRKKELIERQTKMLQQMGNLFRGNRKSSEVCES